MQIAAGPVQSIRRNTAAAPLSVPQLSVRCPPLWQGAKSGPFAASVGLGLALRFLVPVPEGITMQAWTLLSIFVSAIAGARRRLVVDTVLTFCCTIWVH